VIDVITKREAAIISTYTGILIGEFSDVHKYIEKIMGRPVFTHELANKSFMEEIQEKSRDDFISIDIE